MKFEQKSVKKVVLGILGAATMVGASTAMAGIQGSKHDLSDTTNTNYVKGVGEVCVFCHTPHGSDTAAPVPLWNRKLDSTNFTTYDQLGTSTFDSKQGKVGSVSLACLSCHDGSQAVDNVINKAGSGGYNPTTNGNDNKMGTGYVGPLYNANGQMYAGASGNNIAYISKDLRNDHPISIPYGGGGISNTQISTTVDPDFHIGSLVRTTTTASLAQFYLDVSAPTGTRTATDIILYSRPISDFPGLSSSTPGTVTASVECGSCHDPHNASTASATSVAFLRISNAGSNLCLACHDK